MEGGGLVQRRGPLLHLCRDLQAPLPRWWARTLTPSKNSLQKTLKGYKLRGFLVLSFFFLPSGDVGGADQAEAEAAARSLQAFVSYHRLYQLWWGESESGSSQDRLVNGNAAEPCETSRIKAHGLDFDVLFSEQHAHFQAAQRSVREVQEKLSAMVLQHSRARGGQPDPAESGSDGYSTPSPHSLSPLTELTGPSVCRPDPQETLLSLSDKMSKWQNQLKDADETLKVRP